MSEDETIITSTAVPQSGKNDMTKSSITTIKTTSTKKLPPGNISIGTAGYNYTHWRKGVFYPHGLSQSSELRHYTGIFPSVEINASFHGTPRVETLRNWANNIKPGFRFSLKVPQEITHVKKLVGIKEDWDVFFSRIQSCLENDGGCLGVILFQLPPSISKNVDKIHVLGEMIIPSGTKVAFEFRNGSWYCEDVYIAMRRYGFAICENISPDDCTYRTDEITGGDWCYIRFHKVQDRGITCYTDDQLAMEADRMVERCLKKGIVDQYAYFLNDHEGNSVKNASTLIRMVKERLLASSASGDQHQLVKGWKADAVVEKGGKGSIESMFARVKSSSSPPRSNPNNHLKRKAGPPEQKKVEAKRDVQLSPKTKRSKNFTSKSNNTKKVTILNFFAKRT